MKIDRQAEEKKDRDRQRETEKGKKTVCKERERHTG